MDCSAHGHHRPTCCSKTATCVTWPARRCWTDLLGPVRCAEQPPPPSLAARLHGRAACGWNPPPSPASPAGWRRRLRRQDPLADAREALGKPDVLGALLRRAAPPVSPPGRRRPRRSRGRWSASCAPAGTSFYHGMRILPPDRRAAMYAIYAFCRIVDDIADDPAPDTSGAPGKAARPGCLARTTIAGLYRGSRRTAPSAPGAARRHLPLRPAPGGFHGGDRRHADPTPNTSSSRPRWQRTRPVLRPGGRRRRPAVGARLRRCLRPRRTRWRGRWAGHCNTPTSCATWPRMPQRCRLYLPRRMAGRDAGLPPDPAAPPWSTPLWPAICTRMVQRPRGAILRAARAGHGPAATAVPCAPPG